MLLIFILQEISQIVKPNSVKQNFTKTSKQYMQKLPYNSLLSKEFPYFRILLNNTDT